MIQQNNIKTQWQKRVEVMKYIYTCLISEYSQNEIVDNAQKNFNFDAGQYKCIEFFAENKIQIQDNIEKFLSNDWSLSRIAFVERAIIIASYLEFKTSQINKKIIIDQALVTTNRFCGETEKKFINAILDKVLN